MCKYLKHLNDISDNKRHPSGLNIDCSFIQLKALYSNNNLIFLMLFYKLLLIKLLHIQIHWK